MSPLFGSRSAAGVALIFRIVIAGILRAALGNAAPIKSLQGRLRDMGRALKGIDDELVNRIHDWDNTILTNADTLLPQQFPVEPVSQGKWSGYRGS